MGASGMTVNGWIEFFWDNPMLLLLGWMTLMGFCDLLGELWSKLPWHS